MLLKHLRRLMIRLVLGAVLVLLACGVVLYFVPFSSRALDRKIERSLSRSLDLNVTFDRAQVYISRGTVTLRNVCLALPEKPDAPLQRFPRMDVFGSVLLLPFAEEKVFDRIRIDSPSTIRLIESGGYVTAPEFGELLKRLTRRREAKAPGTLRIKQFEIRNGAVDLLSGATSETLVQLRRCDITYTDSPDGLSRVMVRADAVPLPGALLQGRAEFSSNEQNAHAAITIDRLSTTIPERKFPRSITCSRVVLQGEWNNYSARIPTESGSSPMSSFSCALSLQGLTIGSEQTKNMSSLQEVTVRAAGELNRTSLCATLRSLEASLPDGVVQASGTLGLTSPYHYSLNVHKARIPQFLIDQLSNSLAAQDVELKLLSGTIAAQGTLEGTLSAPAESVFNGRARFRNASVRFARVPRSFDSLEGEILVANNVLEAKNIQGRVGHARLTAAARLSGENVLAHPKKLEITWTFDALADDALSFVNGTQPSDLSQIRLEGTVRSEGRIDAALTTPPSIHTTGTLELSNVSVSHPSLPEPLQDISGQLRIDDEKLTSLRLRGKFLGCECYSTCTIAGNRYFWNEPRAEVIVSAEPRPETLHRIVQARYPNIRIPPSSGEAMIQIGYAGRLDMFKSSDVWVRCVPRNWEVAILQQPIERRLSLLNGEIYYEQGRIRAEIPRAHVGNNVFSLSALMENNELEAVVNSDARLEDLKASFPEVLGTFRTHGDAQIRADTRIRNLDNIRFSASKGFAEQFPELLQQLDVSASIVTRDAAFSYMDMPADVTDIDGTFVITKEGLTVKGAHSQWGKSPDCRVDGTVRIENNVPTIRFQLKSPRAQVDEWLIGWRSPGPPKAKSSRSPYKGVKIFGDIAADTAACSGLNGKNLRWKLTYSNSDMGRQLSLDDITFESYGGTAQITGILRFAPEPDEMDLHIAAKGIDVEELLNDYSGAGASVGGVMTGEVALHREGQGRQNLVGHGQFSIEKGRFVRNAIIETLGRLLNTDQFDDITFTNVEGGFEIAQSTITFDRLSFRNSIVELSATGKVMFDGSADAYLYLVLLPKSWERIPLVGNVASFAEKLGRRFVKFHLTGNIKDPTISLIPLSLDEIDRVLFPKTGKEHQRLQTP